MKENEQELRLAVGSADEPRLRAWRLWVSRQKSVSVKAIVRRGAATSDYTGQVSLLPPHDVAAATRNVTTPVRNREREDRDFALSRAKGICEFCGASGCQLPDSRTFLETHHIMPLAEGGADSASNIVALCSNHHREAHYGRDARGIRERLLKVLKAGKQ